jgi:O-methyltransferase
VSTLAAVRGWIRRLGVDVVRYRKPGAEPLPADFDTRAIAVINRVRAHTMTSPERLYALIQAVRHIAAAGIPGDVAECGVWRGGSMMAAALTLAECGDTKRELYLFDTFEGMSTPTALDVSADGRKASALLVAPRSTDAASPWCYAGIDDVRAGMHSTGYPVERMHFVQGKVEETIPCSAPARIALLRLDTDWYESTRHELEHLYPLLSPGGVLIIDDYGHWTGCRKAVDEYFGARGIRLLLNRVDYTGRIAIKPG